MPEKIIIGLCGCTGSGKSTVATLFAMYGAYIIDCDNIAHNVTKKDSECFTEIVDHFGSDIVKEDGNLNRKALANIIFEKSDEKRVLEEITHKYILEDVFKEINSHDGLILVDAPLLFESGLDSWCNYTIVVTADEKVRLKRIMSRDDIDEELALKRIKSQTEEKDLVSRCDFVIHNNSNVKSLNSQIKSIVDRIIDDK